MSRGGWVVLAGWGALIVLFAVAQLAFEPEAAEIALLGGSGLVVVGAGLAALVAERRRRGRRAAPGEVLRWTSASSVALAVGICLIMLGWELGAWMIGIGAGVAALGLAGVIRETKAGRP